MVRLKFDRITAPFDDILIAVEDNALCALDFGGFEDRMRRLLAKRYGEFELEPCSDPNGFSTKIRAYLEGDLNTLDDIPITLGGTPFQERAWHALRTIPPGRTATYAEQAAKLGAPRAARAVGYANSQNPIALVLPCHRVIGTNRTLTGFAGGVETKRWLLAHEGVLLL